LLTDTSYMTLVDTHAHVISGNTQAYPVLESAKSQLTAERAAAGSVETLLSAFDGLRVSAALLVQRTQFYGHDNSYVCDAAAIQRNRLRPICALDASRPECLNEARAWLRRGAAGFRLMQSKPSADLAWLGSADDAPVWKLSCELGLPLNIHFWPANRAGGLAHLLQTLRRFPEATVVVDHLSNCPFDETGRLEVDDVLQAVADERNVIMKITTIPLGRMATEGIPTGAMMDTARSLFGSDRLIWGSDIGQSAGTYEQMTLWAREAVAGWTEADQAAFLSRTASRIYRLNSL
jgi:L-fuconolactonase